MKTELRRLNAVERYSVARDIVDFSSFTPWVWQLRHLGQDTYSIKIKVDYMKFSRPPTKRRITAASRAQRTRARERPRPNRPNLNTTLPRDEQLEADFGQPLVDVLGKYM